MWKGPLHEQRRILAEKAADQATRVDFQNDRRKRPERLDPGFTIIVRLLVHSFLARRWDGSARGIQCGHRFAHPHLVAARTVPEAERSDLL